MRIAVLTELYPPSVGGQEFFFQGLGRELARQGHVVEVYCIGHEAGLPEREDRDGVLVVRKPISPNYKNPTLKWSRRSLRAMLSYALFTRGLANEERHDVYLLNEWPLLHVPFLPTRARQRAMLHWCEVREGRLFTQIQQHFPRMVAGNAAISPSVAQAIRRASGRDVVVLPSGIDCSAYRARRRDERTGILVLGRLAAHKNLPFMIECFGLLKDRGYPGRLVIAGGGPAEAEVRSAAAGSRYREWVEVLGEVSDEQKIELLARSEILAMPSLREGFPRVVAEAMASGLPTVTTDAIENGTRDVVATYGCGIVASADATAFVEGIERAVADWDVLSRACLLAAPSLDWPLIAATFVDAVRQEAGISLSRTVES